LRVWIKPGASKITINTAKSKSISPVSVADDDSAAAGGGGPGRPMT
jgi:hypothetical protein